jgi:Tfp pilus assembly PilM family ATPase
MIRGSGKKGGGVETPAPQPLAPKRKWNFRLSLKAGSGGGGSSKNVHLGVELAGGVIRMVKLTSGPGRSRSLEFKTISIPEQGPDAPELSLVLRLALKDFLGKAEADVWAVVPAETADLRFLQVPKTNKKQLSNAIYWTAKKEASFDDSEVVFDYELQGEVIEKGAPRLSVLAYTVKREEFEKLRNLFLQAGYPLAGITLPSVSMRNLLRGNWVEGGEKTQACLHLGGEFSRIEIFSGGNLQIVRVLKGGLSAMAQSLAEASKEYTPHSPIVEPEPVSGESIAVVPEEAVFSSAIPIEIESMAPKPAVAEVKPAGLSVEDSLTLIENLVDGPQSLPEGHPGRKLSTADVLEMLKPAWERLLRQVQMTFSHHAVTLGNEQVGGLTLSGPLGGDPGILEYLSEKLGLPCKLLDPLSPDNLGRLQIAAPSLSLAERQPYGLLLGLTGADRSACNLLHTYKQKEEEDRVASLNRVVALSWLGVAVVILGFFIWQQTQSYIKQQELSVLEGRLREYQPLVDMPLLLSTGSKVRQAVDNMRRFVNRTRPAAVLRDVTGLTPENVKLFSIVMDLGTPEEQPVATQETQGKPGARPAGKGREAMDTLTLEGYVKGDSQILESLLSAYLVQLRTSPLLGEPSVSKRSVEMTAAGEDVLRFTLSCQVRR